MANILIVDDDPVYSDMTKQRLERAGHRVTVHVGPFGATAAARKPDIDLVILDVFMPGLSGPDLLTLIRQNRAESGARGVLQQHGPRTAPGSGRSASGRRVDCQVGLAGGAASVHLLDLDSRNDEETSF
jgi:CheY-like chemotaxis protein